MLDNQDIDKLITVLATKEDVNEIKNDLESLKKLISSNT
jgi:hypothetical protein